MGFGDKCCVGGCNNDRGHPKKWVIHSHVEKLSFHKPKQSLIEAWSRQVQKGRKDFSIRKSRESVVVCSNHFRDGKPSVNNPIPTLFLTPFKHSNSKSPRERCRLEYQKETSTSVVTKSVVYAGPSEVTPVDNSGIPASDEMMKSGEDSPGLTLCTASAQITRDTDVRLYTGMQNTDAL